MAELRRELFVHRHRLDQSSLSHALCRGRDPSSVVVQLRASLFHVAASPRHSLDGREQTGAAASCLLCRGFLPRECHILMSDLGTLIELPLMRSPRRCAGSCASARSRLYVFLGWLRLWH